MQLDETLEGEKKDESTVVKVLYDFLAIQGTNGSSERVSSVGGDLITDLCFNPSETSVAALICMTHNNDLLFWHCIYEGVYAK